MHNRLLLHLLLLEIVLNLWLLLVLAVAGMVWEEDREVVPEVRLSLHLADNFTDMLVEMLS